MTELATKEVAFKAITLYKTFLFKLQNNSRFTAGPDPILELTKLPCLNQQRARGRTSSVSGPETLKYSLCPCQSALLQPS